MTWVASAFAAVTVAALAAPAGAVTKCTDPATGKTTYSDGPCVGAQKPTKMEWAPDARTNTLAPAAPSRAQRGVTPRDDLEVAPEGASLMRVYRRWIDAERLASQTARIALPQPVATLQEIRRSVGDLSVPACMTSAREALYVLTSKSAEGYLSFMNRRTELHTMVYAWVDRGPAITAFEREVTSAACGPTS